MCIALLIKPEAEITDEVLLTCHRNNKDGSGFAYVKEGKVRMFKTMNFQEFLEKFKEAKEETPSSPFLVHFRIATHGTVDIFNCHPFYVDDSTAFIHNGIIQGMPIDKEKSDTQMFNELILQGLEKDWAFNLSIKPLIEKFIGFSKLVVLNSEEEWEIFNEEKGEWVGDIWFSNGTYKPKFTYNTKATSYNRGWKKEDKKPVVTNVNTFGNNKSTSNVKSLPKPTTSNTDDETFLEAWMIKEGDWHQCDNCCNWESLDDMAAFESLDGIRVYCSSCEDALLDMDFIDPADEVHMEFYIKEWNDKVRAANKGE